MAVIPLDALTGSLARILAAAGAQHCSVGVRDIDLLELRIDCTGPGGSAQGTWLDPKVVP